MDSVFNKDPIQQILAADIRFCRPDFYDDHIWELSSSGGEPPALALSTTYGLRANRMRIFPRFHQGNFPVSDPQTFFSYPQLVFYSANFAAIRFNPFPSLDVCLRLWVPSSQVIIGQISIVNIGDRSESTRLDWLVQLNPLLSGKPMTPTELGVNTVLQGETEKLYPVFYLTGGPQPLQSTYPGLSIDMTLVPGGNRQVTWALASMDSVDSSFSYARQFSSKDLETEQLKIEMADQRSIVTFDFEQPVTGKALGQSQLRGFQLLMPGTQQFQSDSFVRSRTPDDGFFLDENLVNLHPDWSGQSLLDSWYLSQILLPGRPGAIKDILQNFLGAQSEEGILDYLVLRNGKAHNIPAPPLFSSTTSNLSQTYDDIEWLQNIYPSLLVFLRNWLKNDFLETGSLPVWQHPSQTGIADDASIPADTRIQIWEQQQSSNDPYLLSLLCHEAICLLKFAGRFNLANDMNWLTSVMSKLKSSINLCWEVDQGYVYKQINTSKQSTGKVLGTYKINGSFTSIKKITVPGRLTLHLESENPLSPEFNCIISGTDESGEVTETIHTKSFSRFDGYFVSVTNNRFSSVTKIELNGLKKGEIFTLKQVDLQRPNLTLFTPLWAGSATPEQADFLCDDEILGKYMTDQGVSLIPLNDPSEPFLRAPNFMVSMLVDGIARYGKNALALDIYKKHFLNRISQNQLAAQETAASSLDRLIPIQSLLKILGVVSITDNEIILNPIVFSNEHVTVKYNKIKLDFGTSGVDILRNDEKIYTVTEPGLQRIILS